MLNTRGRPRVVFMGTPDYAVPVLPALLDAGYEVAAVYTQPDRATGRGRRLAAPAIKRFAESQRLPVCQPASLRTDDSARQGLASLSPDLIVVAAYGLFLPADVLALPRLGCLNLHPSLLPRYRGPSPVASAILSGDAVTGVTIIRLDEGMDSGPVVAQRETPLQAEEMARDLTARLFLMGAELLLEVLPGWQHGEISTQPQDHSAATVTKRLAKEDGELDWSREATYIARQVRAYDPWPGTFTSWRGKTLKVLEATVTEQQNVSEPPGSVVQLTEGVGVVTGQGVLGLRRLQLEGKRPATGPEFARGHRDFVGSTVGG